MRGHPSHPFPAASVESWSRDPARADNFPGNLVWALHRDTRGRLRAGLHARDGSAVLDVDA